MEGLGDLRRVPQVHDGARRPGHGSEAYQRSPHARQVPQERHFNARLENVVTTRPELYAGQDQEHGREGQAEAHADRLSKLVRLEFRPLNRGRHVAGVHPSRGRVESFWIEASRGGRRSGCSFRASGQLGHRPFPLRPTRVHGVREALVHPGPSSLDTFTSGWAFNIRFRVASYRWF